MKSINSYKPEISEPCSLVLIYHRVARFRLHDIIIQCMPNPEFCTELPLEYTVSQSTCLPQMRVVVVPSCV